MPHRLFRLLDRVRPAIVALLPLTLLAGLLVPVYVDEVGWRFSYRAWLDGVDKLFSDTCGANTLAHPPWFILPARIWSAWWNTALPDPFWVRVSGVACALAWIWMVARLIGRLTADAETRRRLLTLAFAVLSLGLMPLLLAWSRPERPILLALTGSLLLCLGAARRDTDRPGWLALRPVAVLLLGVVALSYHFKTLVLIPIFLACMVWPIRWRARGWSWLMPVALCGGLLLAASAISAGYWFGRYACPDDAIAAADYTKHSLGVSLLLARGNVGGIVLALLKNYVLPHYVVLTAPDVTPMADWLPAHLVTKPVQVIWSVVLVLLWLALFGVVVAAVARTVRRSSWRALAADPRVVLAALLFAAASVWCVSQKVRNIYEATFVLPLLLLAFLLVLGRAERTRDAKPVTPGWLVRLLTGAALVNAVLVGAIYGPSLVRASMVHGYPPHQPLSVSVAGFTSARAEALAAGRACGIALERRPTNLLLDQVTYFPFMMAHLPQGELAVLDKRYRGNITDPVAYLKSRGSAGMVVGCQFLDPGLRARARRLGDFCCLGPPNW